MKYILSLDGGGIRGAATATFLSLVQKEFGISLYDKFDLFAGTSTGALITMALIANKMSPDEIAELYNVERSKRIMGKSPWDEVAGLVQMQPKYDGVGKENVFKEIFGNKKVADIDKPFIITAYDVEKRLPKVFKQKQKYQDMQIAQIVNATSAAPLYFPTVKTSQGEYLIDGGVAANNPAMCAYAEAIKIWKNEEIKMLSVGTGYQIRKIDGDKSGQWGPVGWIRNGLLDVIMEGPNKVVEYQCQQLLGDHYLRINSDLKEANDELDDTSVENIKMLKELGQNWFEQNHEQLKSFLTH